MERLWFDKPTTKRTHTGKFRQCLRTAIVEVQVIVVSTVPTTYNTKGFKMNETDSTNKATTNAPAIIK